MKKDWFNREKGEKKKSLHILKQISWTGEIMVQNTQDYSQQYYGLLWQK